jgi:hypothetical protein
MCLELAHQKTGESFHTAVHPKPGVGLAIITHYIPQMLNGCGYYSGHIHLQVHQRGAWWSWHLLKPSHCANLSGYAFQNLFMSQQDQLAMLLSFSTYVLDTAASRRSQAGVARVCQASSGFRGGERHSPLLLQREGGCELASV